jgi:Protein of unknown function (DUF1588)/Protein of unknown function (DUF1592)/Protein of unknown function (DUF1595)/Protein of unknown function (DUF1585)/Protein of unknown function (DUF1587)
MSLGALACGGSARGNGAEEGAGGSGQTGGSAGTGAGKATGGAPGTPGAPGATGGLKLRVLTRSEYQHALSDLLGTINTPLDLPEDLAIAGFVSVGASAIAVNSGAVPLYEAASRAATAEVFADAARWQKLVGCEPQADLSDDCIVSFIETAGKRAYRRDLTEAEVERWVNVGRETAGLPGSSAAQGLAAVTTGLLQSLHFLYRVESSSLDASSGRLKYDGLSMATRLAFLLTGRPPSEALLAAGASGELDTAEGVGAVADRLLEDPQAVRRMAQFFSELSQAQLVSVVEKSPELFPSFNAELRSSMLRASQLFIEKIVLAPGADVRSFYDSDQTFVDAALAPIYGVAAPASGFRQIKLGPEAGRAGILGQAAVLAGHSQPSYTSPTRRGVFILNSFLCEMPPPPPEEVSTTLTPDSGKQTTRQRLEREVANTPCAECHVTFDPLGYALEHLDPIGQYRATEDGLTIDATASLDGVPIDGAAGLGAALRDNPRALACLMTNFYRDANGRADATPDLAHIDALKRTLASRDYVWRDLVAAFVVSDAFRSAPATAVAEGNQ